MSLFLFGMDFGLELGGSAGMTTEFTPGGPVVQRALIYRPCDIAPEGGGITRRPPSIPGDLFLSRKISLPDQIG